VVKSGNYYIGQVKGNQPNLYQAIQEVIVKNSPVDSKVFKQKARGKDISWYVSVYDAHIGKLHKKWAGLKKIIQVHKVVQKGASSTHSQRYYISNLQTNEAAYYQQKIRHHWLIENQLHWVKDVIHKEDKNRIRTKNGPISMSIISTMALNIHRKKGMQSITASQIKFCCNLPQALETIRT